MCTFLTPCVQTRYLDLVTDPRLDSCSFILNLNVGTVDVELCVVCVREDSFPANKIFAGRGGGWNGEVPLYPKKKTHQLEESMGTIWSPKHTDSARKVPHSDLN